MTAHRIGLSQGTSHHATRKKKQHTLDKKPHLVAELLHERERAQAVATKVGYQFPKTPEGKLMRHIFVQSVTDLYLWAHRRSAVLHLQGWMFEAEVCGINSEWIRYQFRQANVNIEDIEP